MKILITCASFILTALFSFGQGRIAQSGSWTANPFDQKVFVENQGQFDEKHTNGKPILFGARIDGIDVYFTEDGLTYRYEEHYLPKEAKKEKEEAEEELVEKMKVKQHYLKTEWIGCSNSAIAT